MRKFGLFTFIGIGIAVAAYLLFFRAPPEQLDYSVRVGASPDNGLNQSNSYFTHVEFPKIGPYPATGYGDPSPNRKPQEFVLVESVPKKSPIVITGSVEVDGGISAPTSFLVTISKYQEIKNPRQGRLSSKFVHVKFSKPNIIEHSGNFSAKLTSPERPGEYWIQLSTIPAHKTGVFFYARAKLTVK